MNKPIEYLSKKRIKKENDSNSNKSEEEEENSLTENSENESSEEEISFIIEEKDEEEENSNNNNNIISNQNKLNPLLEEILINYYLNNKNNNNNNYKKQKINNNYINNNINNNNLNNNNKINNNNNWKLIGNNTVYFKNYNNFKPGKYLLSFELEDTLITLKNSYLNIRKFNPENWKYKYDLKIILQKLNYYMNKNYVFVIFSNNIKINNGSILSIDLQKKIDDIFENNLKIPILYFCSKGDDYYSKPCIGMFELFMEYINNYYNNINNINDDNSNNDNINNKSTNNNNNFDFDIKNSIFVGKFENEKKNKNKVEFSNIDYKFALNCNMQFYTSDEFFINNKKQNKIIYNLKNEYKLNLYNPHIYDNQNNNHIKILINNNYININNINNINNNNDINTNTNINNNKYNYNNEMIILIGSHSSSKTTFAENYLVKNGYKRISLEQYSNIKKCIEYCIKYIKNKNNIIIDLYLPTIEKRKKFVNLAKEYGIKLRAFVFNVNKKFCIHLNKIKKVNKERKQYDNSVGDLSICNFFSCYEPPNINEGYDEICYVNFVPGPFINDKEKKLFYLYY